MTTGDERGLDPVETRPTAEVREATFVIVPAYQEATTLPRVLEELVATYPQVVVVDDGSSDGTDAVARARAPYVLRHLVNRGQGAALQTGMVFALSRGARWIVTFDADGQHRVEDVAGLLAPLVRGECEITLGSRFLGQALHLPPMRWLVLRLAVLFTRTMSGVRLTDTHNGLRAFSRDAAERIEITMDRMAHASELIDLIAATNLPFREVPVTIHYSDYSKAKGQSSGGAIRVAFHYLIGRLLG